MEMLAVTPLKSYELILGKLLPFVIIALFDIVLVLLIATLWFNVWIKGSVFDLFYMGVIFMLTGLGLGIFISTISQTQRQAMMTVIFIILPQIIISGFIFPIANMPKIIQLITYLIPLRYFLEIVRNIFLKGVGINYLWYSVWPMVVFGVVILSLSIIRFRKKID
jgi:ABC-2 type transport system permease protein